ncbi:MAG: hypothetical protein ACRDT4_11680 [Micromonosporaceae bacterium]
MTRVAITGHRGLDGATTALVAEAIATELRALSDSGELIGVSCLADGADQVFARALVDAGGQLVVVVPASEYRDGLPEAAWDAYDELLAKAVEVRRLPYVRSDEHAHMAASVEMLRGVDRLFAVWDGHPARGHGGTADVVAYARGEGIPVTVIWPNGARRD